MSQAPTPLSPHQLATIYQALPPSWQAGFILSLDPGLVRAWRRAHNVQPKPPEQRTCMECGAAFMLRRTDDAGRQFCTIRCLCRWAGYEPPKCECEAKPKTEPQPPEQRTCRGCGAWFILTDPRRRFCDAVCRQRWHNEQENERNARLRLARASAIS